LAKTFKIDYFFRAYKHGWIETWYMRADTHQEVFDGAELTAVSRSGLLGACAYIQAIRVSDIDILQDSKVKFYASAAFPRMVGTSDNPGNAVLARVEADTGYRRPMWLRGIPDVSVARTPATCEIKVPDDIATALQAFELSVLAEPVFRIKARSREATGSVGPKITAIAAGVEPETTVVTTDGLFVGRPGEVARMVGWTGPDSRILNRTYRILDVTGFNTTLDLDFAKITKPAKDKGGKLLSRIVNTFPITAVFPERVAIRKTGRPSFIARGRARARPRA